jgi:hypothetical protein
VLTLNYINKKHTVFYLLGLSGIALALVFMIAPNDNSMVLAQQNITNPATGGSGSTVTPNIQRQQEQNPYSMSTSLGSQNQNWTGSISLFSPIIDAFKSKIHTTLNDATTNALNAVGGSSNTSAVAAFIHPERGFLVYHVFVLDPSNIMHRVIVDPGNGKVLSNQPMSLMDIMSMTHPSTGMMMGGPGTGMMDHSMGMMMGPPFPPSHDMMMQHGMMGGPGTGMMDHSMGMMMDPHPPGMMMGGP